jgi:hypothetical protein
MGAKPKPVEVFTGVQLTHHTILLMVTAEKFIRGQNMDFPHNQERQQPLSATALNNLMKQPA